MSSESSGGRENDHQYAEYFLPKLDNGEENFFLGMQMIK